MTTMTEYVTPPAISKLLAYMVKNQRTQGAFAREVGVSGVTVSSILSQARRPSPGLMERIEIATDGKVRFGDWSRVGNRWAKSRNTEASRKGLPATKKVP